MCYDLFLMSKLKSGELRFPWDLWNKKHYANEIRVLEGSDTSCKALSKQNPLYKHCPYIDNDGILRAKGRIDEAPSVSHNTKRPVLLPKEHYVVNLILQDLHEKYFHGNNETVVNEIRQEFVIPRLRTVLKTLVKKCQWCKIKKAKPEYPQMASRPVERLSSFCRPFTFVGVDYFGPLTVTIGRRQVHSK